MTKEIINDILLAMSVCVFALVKLSVGGLDSLFAFLYHACRYCDVQNMALKAKVCFLFEMKDESMKQGVKYEYPLVLSLLLKETSRR